MFTAVLFVAGSPAIWAQGTGTTTQAISASFAAASALSVGQSSLSLVRGGSIFSNYTASLTVQYKVRTTSSGSSTITVHAASNFSPANGPSVSGTTSDLTYTCSSTTGTSVNQGCTGTQQVKTSASSVVSVGSGICSGTGCANADPSSVTLNFSLVDNPAFKTGAYSLSLTFTTSAL